MTPIERAKLTLGPLVQTQRATRCVFEDHEDSHKSATLYPERFFCHACSKGLDTLDYYAHVNGLTLRQALVKLGALGGTPPKPPPPTPPGIKAFAEEFVDKLITLPEYRLAKSWVRDIKRYDIPDLITEANLCDPTFLNACRHKGLNPLLVHDLIFMEVA